MTAHYYHIEYKGGGANWIKILTNGEESYFFSDGFFGYECIFRFCNNIDDIISYFNKKEKIEKIILEKTIYDVQYEPDLDKPIIDIKKCRIPNKNESAWIIVG